MANNTEMKTRDPKTAPAISPLVRVEPSTGVEALLFVTAETIIVNIRIYYCLSLKLK